MRDRFRRRLAAAEQRHPRLGARLLTPARVVTARVHDDQLGIQAGSLTYGAFLAIPPILILALSAVSLVVVNDAEARHGSSIRSPRSSPASIRCSPISSR